MSPETLTRYLHQLLQHQVPISTMIWGPPGIGKSSIVRQLAERANYALRDVRLSQLAPTDLRGLPVADHELRQSRWYPPEFLPTEGQGILFLDELNMAVPAIQAIAQQLILDRRVGSYVVPEGWLVWAAGNRKEDRATVFDMPAPLANRFIHLSVEPDFESFKAYALTQSLHEHLLAFLSFRPALLHCIDPQQPAWPSPRSWMMAHTLYALQLDLAPVIGEAAAAEFTAFLKVYEQIPDINRILTGEGEDVLFPGEPSLRYALIIALTLRSETVEQMGYAFEWAATHTAPEWIQLLATDLFSMARKRSQLAALGRYFREHTAFTGFLQNHLELLGASR